MWLLIIFISVHDGYLVLANRLVMPHAELNPLGRWLIHHGGRDIWLMLAFKAAGTVLVATFLLTLRSLRPRLALCICAVVAIFQVSLLLFLYSG